VEQAVEHKAGNPFAKDWQDEAQQILEGAVHAHSFIDVTYLTCIDTDEALLQEPA